MEQHRFLGESRSATLTGSITLAVVLAALLAACSGSSAGTAAPAAASANPAQRYDSYAYGSAEADKTIDIGTVPTSILVSFVSQCLMHDTILQKQLGAQGWKLKLHSYDTGAAMFPYLDGRIDFMTIGDIPAFVALSRGEAEILLTTSINTMSLVANKASTAPDLRGKRVGFNTGTVTHFGVYRTLEMGGLSLEDVSPVQISPDKMEAALRDNQVDAGSVYEPFTSYILTHLPDITVLSRYLTYTYLCADPQFTRNHPELTEYLLAAIYRAARWIAADPANIGKGMAWVKELQAAYFGQSFVDAAEPWLSLVRSDTIAHPSYPMLPQDLDSPASLQHQEFLFLKKVGLIAAEIEWKAITDRVKLDLMPQLLAGKRMSSLDEFAYADGGLYP